jgi:hypothetical protein
VQAPHTPCSQPKWVPVRPQSSRKKSARVLRGSTTALRRVPSTDVSTTTSSGRAACCRPHAGVVRTDGLRHEEVARRHGDFAIVGVACAIEVGADDSVSRAGIALFGVGSTPYRAFAAESSLVGTSPGLELVHIGELAVADMTPSHDVYAPGAYRQKSWSGSG